MFQPLLFCASTRRFADSPRLSLPQLAAAKFDGVQFDLRDELPPRDMSDTAQRHIRALVNQHALQVAACDFPLKKPLLEKHQLNRRVDAIRKAMILARGLGASRLLLKIGRVPDVEQSTTGSPTDGGTTTTESRSPGGLLLLSGAGDLLRHMDTPSTTEDSRGSIVSDPLVLIAVLNDLAAHGNHFGVELTLQVAGNQPDRIRQFLAKIDRGPVSICFDPAVSVFGGRSPIDDFRGLHDVTGYLRLRDAEMSEESASIETAIGDGVIPWDEFIASLHESELRKWCQVDRTGGDSAADDILQGLSRLRRLLPELPA